MSELCLEFTPYFFLRSYLYFFKKPIAIFLFPEVFKFLFLPRSLRFFEILEFIKNNNIYIVYAFLDVGV